MLLAAFFLCLGALNAFALPVEKNVNVRGDISYLLPDNAILPITYIITIDVTDSFDNIEKREFFGKVIISALVNADVQDIKMHAADIEISNNNIKVEVEDEPDVEYFKTSVEDINRQFLIIELKQKLIKGKKITITIESYKGKLQNNMNGFYVSQYKQNEDKDEKIVLTTQFQPTHARKAFPCFDEPKYKAQFQLNFKKQDKYKVISNMESSEPNQGSNSKIVTFPVTPIMSTYLVAFIVHEFDSMPSLDDPKYNIWSRPEANLQTKTAAKYVQKIVEDLNEFTGISYNEYIDKMDMAALPDFSAGAMENWGLLTYRETALLVDEKLSTNKDIQRVVTVISHEVAHQWFGDLITLTWWSNTWLNEGFATYFQYHTTGNVLPEWEMKDQFVVEQQQMVFEIDALAKTTPLTLEVYTPIEISSHFGSISYAKGGSVIRMMEHFLGSDIFQKGLQRYLNSNRLKNTEPPNLWSALQNVIDENNVNLEYPIKGVMDNWISQAGYPVINVKYDSTGYVTFSQQRFYINSDENTRKSNDQTWFVPISYTTSKDLNFTNLKPEFWLTPNEPIKTITTGADIDYLVVNIQEAGYYRVNYDDILWKKLVEVLPEEEGKKIHYMNKAQIVDDVMNLARAGLVDYQIAFDITDFLATETNYYPWYSAFQAFRFLLQRYSDSSETGKVLRMYLGDLMALIVKDKEFEEIDETQVEVFNRVASLEWACNLGHKKCIAQAKDLYKAFKTENKPLPRNLRSIVYCTALRNGDRADWDFLWDMFIKSNSAAEKIGIINALGCSNDKNTLKEFLERSIDPTSVIRKQDALYVFTAVYTGNTIGVDEAFDFLKDKHEEMKNNYNGMNDLQRGVLGLGNRLTDKNKIEEFKALLKKDDNFATFRDAAIEIVEQNVAWADKYSDIIGNILTVKRNSAANILINKYVMFVSLGFISIYLSIFH